jgi:hypothetical protein
MVLNAMKIYIMTLEVHKISNYFFILQNYIKIILNIILNIII